MSSSEPGARERSSPGSPYLFSEIPLEGPLEELERVHHRRRETARTLGEDERGGRLDEAYEVARACLEAVLDEAHAPGSSLVEDAAVTAENDVRAPVAPAGSSPPEAADGGA